MLIEKRLNAMGISTYEQIANWTDADIARVSQTLDFKGRIERESWVEQARILSTVAVRPISHVAWTGARRERDGVKRISAPQIPDPSSSRSLQ